MPVTCKSPPTSSSLLIYALLANVETPETLMPPAETLIPDLAVIIPMESTFVTSSYVNVPAIETLPLAFILTTLMSDTQS